jgi:hypothetical protein
MTVVAVSRWKGDFQNIGIAREIAPLLKKHGALSVQVANCTVGTYAGQIITVLTFQDWEAYGKAMQGETPPDWWTPLLSSEGSGKVSNGPGTASFYR